MVQSLGIEPSWLDFQSSAMTTFANFAFKLEGKMGFEPTLTGFADLGVTVPHSLPHYSVSTNSRSSL